MRRIAITGSSGNLGQKLLRGLSENSTYELVLGLDLVPMAGNPELPANAEQIICDLTDPADMRWQTALERVEGVVHLAAKHPFPDATWEDAARSLDMTINLLHGASNLPGLSRFVFASSNHVMGGYKGNPPVDAKPAGWLTCSLPELVGTKWRGTAGSMDSTPYAVHKFAGERLCLANARNSEAQLRTVCVRIGWCQPGENDPRSISGAGTPHTPEAKAPATDAVHAANDKWFREMWLANADMVQIFDCALQADAQSWPGPGIIVNGVSANAGMAWSLDEAQAYLKYRSAYDVYSKLRRDTSA